MSSPPTQSSKQSRAELHQRRLRRLWQDIIRVTVMIIVASILLFLSVPLAEAVGQPALAPWGMYAGLGTYGVALSHVFRRALFPYLDLKSVAAKACQAPFGAGLVFLGVCIVLASLLTMSGAARAQEVPPGARMYMPILKEEQRRYWPSFSLPSTLAAQVEQESCISLSHPRCWNPRSELRTAREQGVGFGQITRTKKMDALSDLRAQFPQELRDWAWNSPNLYDPRYQLRAIILMNRRNYERIVLTNDEGERSAMMLAAYNGGLGGLMSDRKLCQATKGCDHRRWFGHVERTSMKSKTRVHGYGKSFFEINREYPVNVLRVRRPKYVYYMDSP